MLIHVYLSSRKPYLHLTTLSTSTENRAYRYILSYLKRKMAGGIQENANQVQVAILKSGKAALKAGHIK